ncbi:MAG TPA: flagellar hook-basal body complex protein FliE [Candidatus Ruthenibacterium merdavium]|uniref:Flagellar hook-basal body complex protein FliE n=1 Tax=Candidatus Ruthenibacterium merdavium TaxID=2838752 RepID=A0A9D2Q798_9FIRM|nr:flagellar hook-basal body complex protein FliE [Candidatus Ruthenibacterium merdavium]
MLNMVFMQGITPIEPMEKMSFENVGAAADASQGKQFGNILQQAVQELEQAQNNSRADTMMLVNGDADDLAQIQINSMKTSTLLQTTVQLTSRMVNTYKEIMQMQV